MAYTPQQWHDDDTSAPYGPINGARLNYIEAGIEAAAAVADAAGGGGTASFGTATPLMDGAGAAGTAILGSHQDHVHPTDTSRAALASPTLTGTPAAPTAAVDTSTTQLATTAYVVGQGYAKLASPTFTGTPVLPTGTTATTQSAADGSTKLATTAYVDAADALKVPLSANGSYFGMHQFGINCYSSIPIGVVGAAGIGAPNAGDARWCRVVMGASGTLHDVSALVTTTGGNWSLGVLDTGQANGTHTTRTCLYLSGTAAVGAQGAWMTADPGLTVARGDTLEFYLRIDATSGKMANGGGAPAGLGTMPNSSFFPSSGAGTSSQKVFGTIATANMPAAVNGTITDANMVAAAATPFFVWRIT